MEREVVIDCPRCEGSGIVSDPEGPDDEIFLDQVCPACLGEGWLDGYVEDCDE